MLPSSYLLEVNLGRGTGMAGGRAGDDQRGVRVKHLGYGYGVGSDQHQPKLWHGSSPCWQTLL